MGLGTFCSGDVQRRIHHVTGEFHIRAVLNGKGLQRDDGHRILHLTIRQGITACQSQVVLWRVEHAQRTTTHQIDVVRVIGIQVGHDVGTISHVQCHIHLETCQLRTFYDGLCTITEVGKLNQFIQLVIRRQRAVAKHVAHIGRAQHVETATHRHIVQSTTDTCKEIDEGLTVSYALLILLGIDNLIVLSPQTYIRHDMVWIGKVHTAMNVQFIILRRIEIEVIDGQLGILND